MTQQQGKESDHNDQRSPQDSQQQVGVVRHEVQGTAVSQVIYVVKVRPSQH